MITVGCPTHQHNKYGLTPAQMAANSRHHLTAMELQSQLAVPTKLILSAKTNKFANDNNNNVFGELISRQCFVTDYTMSQYLESGWYPSHYSRKQMCDVRYN